MPIATRIDQRLRALALARDCALLGARLRTLHHLSGLPLKELKPLLFTDSTPLPRGRAPDTRDWYHTASLPHRVESSLVIAPFERLRAQGFGAAEALLSAYRFYLTLCGPTPRISFDRAFDLAANTAGLWIVRSPSFRITLCAHCGSEFLDGLQSRNVATTAAACPFCKLVARAPRDPRLGVAVPAPSGSSAHAIPYTSTPDTEIHAEVNIAANGGAFPGAPPPG